MQVQAFSCARPLPEHMDRLCLPATSAELDALIAEEAYTQDLGRSLYLVARRDGELVRRGVVCCGDADELAMLALENNSQVEGEFDASSGDGHEVASVQAHGHATDVASNKALVEASEAHLEQMRSLGAHAEPIVCEYEASYALDVIVAAAQSATPLYNLSNGSETQVVVWRVSREDAVDAIRATLAAVACAPTNLSAPALKAAKALADEARESRPNLDARSAVLHPLCLLVPKGQDMSRPLLPSNGLLMHRFA